MNKRSNKHYWLSVVSVVGVLVLWYIITEWLKILPDYSLPSPVKVFGTFIKKFTSTNPDGGTLFQHLFASLEVSLGGFMLGSVLGVPLGIAMAWSKRVDMIVRPLFDLLRPIPPLAWIPIMILCLGIGTFAKASIIFVSAFIPCVLNSYTGIKQTSAVHLWVGQTFGASKFQLLRRVAIPTALPNIFTGLRVSLNNSWVTLVAAEMLASTKGLGYMIQIGMTVGRADIIIVGMLAIGFMGALMALVLKQIEDKFVRGRITS